MKKNQILFATILGILTLSISFAAVQGCKGYNTRVTIRPLDDWLERNPFGVGMTWNAAYFGHGRANDYYWAWPDSPFGFFTGIEYDYNGHVKEKVLRDGSIEISVMFSVKDAYIELYHSLYDENGDPITTMNYFGDLGDIILYAYCDYYFEFKFTLDAEYDGYEPWGIPSGTREAGCQLPFYDAIFMLPEQLGIHVNSLTFIASGKGEEFAPGWRWPADGVSFPPGPFVVGDVRLFMLFHAQFGEGSTLDWPIGVTGFRINTIRYF
jgi:hypothetical protein